MLSCKEISYLLSSSKELSIMKRTELRMHLLMCSHCANYHKQLLSIRKNFSKLLQKKSNSSTLDVKDLENQILKNIPVSTPIKKDDNNQ